MPKIRPPGTEPDDEIVNVDLVVDGVPPPAPEHAMEFMVQAFEEMREQDPKEWASMIEFLKEPKSSV